ncbi:MAG: ATP-binding SpoIIE family protein phosphatase, partial [Nevskiales bacterium]
RMAEDLLAQRRLQQELEMARELQQQLLPPPLPPPFPLNGVNISAYEVSGDFYDYFPLDDGRTGFTIGDVSGKGLNAALLMVRTTSLLRGLGRAESSLPALLQRVNQELCETSSQGMFVCAVAGVYDPRTRLVSWCNAGFPAVLRHREDGHFESLPAQAPPLGIEPTLEVPLEQLTLGDESLYFYTDGAIEVRGADGYSLDEEGLQVIIRRHASLAPKQRLDAMVENLCALRLRDDTTLLVLEDRAAQSSMQRLAEMRVLSRAESLRDLRGMVADACRTAGCGNDLVEKLVLAVDEACANVIRHAYGGRQDGEIMLSIDREHNRLLFRLRDFAESVDPGRLKPRPPKPTRPGGLGLHLIDSIMDNWELRTPDDGRGNLLVMTKTIT